MVAQIGREQILDLAGAEVARGRQVNSGVDAHGHPLAAQVSDDRPSPVLLSVHTDSSSGVCWTGTLSGRPNGENGYSLSSILETGPIASRYYLSPTACRGILKRARKRGRTLPEHLREALEAVARMTTPDKPDT